MAEKIIKCTQCKAADLTKTEENVYQCNYCGSKIIIDEPKFNFNDFFKDTFKDGNFKKYGYSYTTTDPGTQTTVLHKPARLGCFIGIFLLLGITSGIVIPIISKFGNQNSKTSTGLTKESNGWQLSYTNNCLYAYGSKGPVIWVFEEYNKDWKRKKIMLTILNPITKKFLIQKAVVPDTDYNANVPSVWDLFQGGKVFGDTIFFSPKKGVFEARNIYSGEVVMDRKQLELLSGSAIASVQTYSSSRDPYIRIESAMEDVLYYLPTSKKVVNRDVYNKDETFQFKYYFALIGSGDKKSLARIYSKVKAGEKSNYIYFYSFKDYNSSKQYYSRSTNIKSVDSIPTGQYYFNAELLDWTDTTAVLKYKENKLEESPYHLSCVHKSGKTKWSVCLDKLQYFKPKDATDLRFEFMAFNGKIVVTANNARNSAIGIDANTGKVEWDLKIEK